MKKLTKLLSALAAVAMTLGMMSVPAMAATVVPGTNNITAFKKYLVVDKEVTVPEVDFTFTIEPGSAVPGIPAISPSVGSPAVMAGPTGAMLTYDAASAASVTVPFTNTDSTFDIVQPGDTVVLTPEQKYVVKSIGIDLTRVTFTQPGIYRYVITEGCNNPAVKNDIFTRRYLDVYVDSDEDGNLIFNGTGVLHKTDIIQNGGVYNEKDDGFTNSYPAQSLTFSKTVTGNQGYRGKYFEFTVQINNAVPNTVYTVDLTRASASDDDGHINPTTLTADPTGSVTAIFYLKHGEDLSIYGLTTGNIYTVVEDPEDYTPSYMVDGGNKVDGVGIPETTMDEENHRVDFTNDRSGTVPTGILLEVAPYALVVLLSMAGAVLMLTKKRRSAR